MRFPTVFDRVKPSATGKKALGSDLVPASDLVPGLSSLDNLFSCRVANINGWPPQRIVVVCRFIGTGTPVPIAGNLYAYEHATACWYLINASPVTIYPAGPDSAGNGAGTGLPAFFDMIALHDFPNVRVNALPPASTAQGIEASAGGGAQGGIDVILNAIDPGGAAINGTYRFAMGADMSASQG